ncbi:MAG TPA: radical SAM protein [Candidatus Paceibacterota bacterium]|nr:radical SAM protein [Candidatus Paceibacterota bacterium]
MKSGCVLVFPPVWEVAAPYMAGPVLAAYLRQERCAVHLLDANNLFWNHFKKDSRLVRRIHEQCIARCRDSSLTLEEGAAAHKAAQMSPEEFEKWFNRVSIGSPIYELVARTFGSFRQIPGRPVNEALRYHDKYFADISHSHAATSSSRLFEQVVTEPGNPWRAFARDHLLPSIAFHDPVLIGISVVAPNQVVPAFALAVEARRAWPNMSIVFGGSWVTHLRERIAQVPWFSELGFLFAPYQGEAVLVEMLKAIRQRQDPAPIAHRVMHFAKPLGWVPLRQLPGPDFSDLPLDTYAEPGHLPLRASRGCYWAKCRFCSYPVLEPRYELRPENELHQGVGKLVEAYGAHHVAFVDPSMSVPLARRVSSVVRESGWQLTWGAFGRFEDGFTRDVLRSMADGGCTVLHWGLESGSARILRALDKGVDHDCAVRILEASAEAGIHSRLLMMYGFPDETAEDLQASFEFVERNLGAIGSVCWSRCTVEIDTPMGEDLQGRAEEVMRETDLALGFVVTPPYGDCTLRRAEMRMAQLSALAAHATRCRHRSQFLGQRYQLGTSRPGQDEKQFCTVPVSG